jgi:hypothetical protein
MILLNGHFYSALLNKWNALNVITLPSDNTKRLSHAGEKVALFAQTPCLSRALALSFHNSVEFNVLYAKRGQNILNNLLQSEKILQ